jgi:citrate synthase
MLFAIPAEKYQVNPVIEQALNQIMVLHADHGQCASTTTVRAAGSSGANLFACVAAGLASMWGPMHGGANEASMQMLGDIESVEQVPAFISKVKGIPGFPSAGLWQLALQISRSPGGHSARNLP